MMPDARPRDTDPTIRIPPTAIELTRMICGCGRASPCTKATFRALLLLKTILSDAQWKEFALGGRVVEVGRSGIKYYFPVQTGGAPQWEVDHAVPASISSYYKLGDTTPFTSMPTMPTQVMAHYGGALCVHADTHDGYQPHAGPLDSTIAMVMCIRAAEKRFVYTANSLGGTDIKDAYKEVTGDREPIKGCGDPKCAQCYHPVWNPFVNRVAAPRVAPRLRVNPCVVGLIDDEMARRQAAAYLDRLEAGVNVLHARITRGVATSRRLRDERAAGLLPPGARPVDTDENPDGTDTNDT
jgi:hypothetical protein